MIHAGIVSFLSLFLTVFGVTVLDSIETYDYGKFVHILDPDSNKIELWEPVDEGFEKTQEGETTK